GLGFASAPPNALILQYAGERTAGVSTGVATMFATSGSITAPALVSAFIRFGGADPSAALRSEMMLASAIAAACGAAAAFLPVGIPRR
ncbi:MAG TPA: hypothetical protein VEJ20_04075, partial [Candidatus Eremiobacteraceae bacterium]|nr:hypothetical protein [Candidatus Eremiobacteraceae bacterium]